MQIRAFVDAAVALHHDSKSHSEVIVTVGGAVVYVSSGKQGCVTSSPTESELVVYSDKLGLVELFHEFVCFLVGRSVALPIVYQDYTSVISLVTRIGGVTRTKHLRARMNLVKESLELGRSLVLWLETK